MNCGKNGQVETGEHDDRGDLGPDVRIHAAGDLRPPVVQAGEVAHDGAADHDEVEVRDHEVGVVDVHVNAERRREEAGQAADEEQAEEAPAPRSSAPSARSRPRTAWPSS